MPSDKRTYFVPSQTRCLLNNSRLIIISHEYIQPLEMPLLENNHGTNVNNKLYKLIQSTHTYEFSVTPKGIKLTRELEFLWPRLKIKNSKGSHLVLVQKR